MLPCSCSLVEFYSLWSPWLTTTIWVVSRRRSKLTVWYLQGGNSWASITNAGSEGLEYFLTGACSITRGNPCPCPWNLACGNPSYSTDDQCHIPDSTTSTRNLIVRVNYSFSELWGQAPLDIHSSFCYYKEGASSFAVHCVLVSPSHDLIPTVKYNLDHSAMFTYSLHEFQIQYLVISEKSCTATPLFSHTQGSWVCVFKNCVFDSVDVTSNRSYAKVKLEYLSFCMLLWNFSN